MGFRPNPGTIYYTDVVSLLVGLKEQANVELNRIEESAKNKISEIPAESEDDLTLWSLWTPEEKEQFCYWAGEKEGLKKALFYLWDAGQQKENSHPIRAHHFFLDTP